MLRAAFAVLLISFCSAQIGNVRFTLLEGKTADPCNFNLDSQRNRDCGAGQRQRSSVTVLLPSLGGTHVQRAQLDASTFPLTVNGINFPSPPAQNFYGRARAGTIVNGVENIPTCAAGIDGPTAAVDLVGLTAAEQATRQIFRIPAAWMNVPTELEQLPRRLCWSPDGVNWRYTGFMVGVVWNCATGVANQECSQLPVNTGDYLGRLSALQQAMRRAQTRCCPGALGTLRVGQCINTNLEDCCGGATAIVRTRERCCNAARELTAPFKGSCPCGQTAADANLCPAGEACCTPRKYTEINTGQAVGQCYNTVTQRCCDTGNAYDPGTQQCCTINGIQSLDVPCPCGSDGDCAGGQVNSAKNTGFLCCKQVVPFPLEQESCSKYANYPTGTGPYQAQRCLGNCFDPRYQICCNGVTCRLEYERCCNTTCCNKFVGTCVDSYHPGTPRNANNWLEYAVHYDQCTTIEQLSPIKSFWIFVLPAMLLVATLSSLALVLIFVNKATARPLNYIEYILAGLAILIVLLAIPCYFAPVYKYGVVMIFIGLFTIVVAAARIKLLNLFLVLVYFIALVYLFDPFNGNAFFTLASGRLSNGLVDMETSGILHATGKMYHDIPNSRRLQYCTNYYDYFALDPMVHDYDRLDNPQVPSFGYCSRSWVTALMIFEGFLLITTLVNFVVSILALILRFKEDRGYDPIELEVRGQGAPMGDLVYLQ